MTSTTDFDNAEITQQYSHINTRFDLSDEELDNDNSSARLFERSRIKALAGEHEQEAVVINAYEVCNQGSSLGGLSGALELPGKTENPAGLWTLWDWVDEPCARGKMR